MVKEADQALDVAVDAYNAALSDGVDGETLARLNAACIDAELALTAARLDIPADQFAAMVGQIARRAQTPYTSTTIGTVDTFMAKVRDDGTVDHAICLAREGKPSHIVRDWWTLDRIQAGFNATRRIESGREDS